MLEDTQGVSRASVSAGEQSPSIDVIVDLAMYPLEVVMATGHVFIDRYYVYLDKLAEDRVRISLSAKPDHPAPSAVQLGGELQNELLTQALRQQMGARHEKIRELLLARALFGAAPKVADPDEPPVDGDECDGVGGPFGGVGGPFDGRRERRLPR